MAIAVSSESIKLCFAFAVLLALVSPVHAGALPDNDYENYVTPDSPQYNFTNLDLAANNTIVYAVNPYTEVEILLLLIIAFCEMFNLITRLWTWFTNDSI